MKAGHWHCGSRTGRRRDRDLLIALVRRPMEWLMSCAGVELSQAMYQHYTDKTDPQCLCHLSITKTDTKKGKGQIRNDRDVGKCLENS